MIKIIILYTYFIGFGDKVKYFLRIFKENTEEFEKNCILLHQNKKNGKLFIRRYCRWWWTCRM